MWASILSSMGAMFAADSQRKQASALDALLAGNYSSFHTSPDYCGANRVLPADCEGRVLTTNGTVMSWEPIASRRDKCDSCGSREFKEHGGRTVCAYCRSGA